MPAREPLYSATAWGLFAQVCQLVASFLLLIGVAPWLGPLEFGLAGLVAIVIGLAGAGADGGMNVLCVQQDGIDQIRAGWFAARIGLLLSLLVALLAGVLGALLGGGRELASLLLAAAPMPLLFAWTSTARARTTRALRFPTLALVDVALAALVATLAIVWARGGYGAWALVLADVCGAVGATALYWLLAPRARRGPHAPRAADGARIVTARLADTGLREGDRLVVATLIGTAALGIYRFGLRHSLALVDRFNAVVDQAALPLLSRAHRAGDDPAPVYLRVTRLYALCVVPAGALLAVLGPALVAWIYPHRWHEAQPVVRALGHAVMAAGVNSQPGVLWLAVGKARVKMRWSIANLVSLLVIVPAAVWGGVLAVVWVLAARSVVAALVAHALLRRDGVALAAYGRAVAPGTALGLLILAVGIALDAF